MGSNRAHFSGCFYKGIKFAVRCPLGRSTKTARSEGTTPVLGQMKPLHGTPYNSLFAFPNQERVTADQ